MQIDKVPLLGKISHSMKAIVVNFCLLGVICVILGVSIPFYPQVLDVLFSALLIVTGLVFFNLAFHFYKYRNKLKKFFE